jgi:hypothetical protein
VVAALHRQNLGVDRRGVHGAGVDQADGPLVEAALDHPAEEAGTGAHADQAVEGHGVARMGRRLVVGPGAAAQLLMRLSWWTITSE